MNRDYINKFCKRNKIEIFYNLVEDCFKVYYQGNLMYQSSDYKYCLDFITEVIINVKHSHNR